MKLSLFILTIVVLIMTPSKGIHIFDPGDCKMDARLSPLVMACSGKYISLTGITDDKYNSMSLKDQTQARKDFFAAGLCAMRYARILDENEFIHKDKLMAYYEAYLDLPKCRKDLILSKIDCCFKNYKGKKQNFPVVFCFYVAQMEICDVKYKSVNGECSAHC